MVGSASVFTIVPDMADFGAKWCEQHGKATVPVAAAGGVTDPRQVKYSCHKQFAALLCLIWHPDDTLEQMKTAVTNSLQSCLALSGILVRS